MQSNPRSPGPTCHLEPPVLNTNNFCSEKSGHDKRGSDIITPAACQDSGSHASRVILAVSVHFLLKRRRNRERPRAAGNIKEARGGLSTFPWTQPALFYN